MSSMPSIAFVSGSKAADGIFRGNYQVYRAAAELGFPSRWVQCIDPSDPEGHYRGGTTVVGRRFRPRSLELGVNRLWTFPRQLRQLEDDRIFLGDPTFLRLATPATADRLVVHVHDIRPLTEHRDRRDAQWMFRYALPRLRHARRIMVHTEHVRHLIERVPGVLGRVYVLPPHSEVPGTVAERHVRTAQGRLAQEASLNVVYVATDRPYKNLRFFFELARVLSSERSPRFQFTLVSRLGRRSAKDLDEVRPSNLTVVPFASDLAPIYEDADILAFPSLYEGFGLPILEALSYGMPVIANDIEPMREILGDAAALAAPGDLVAWSEAIRALGDSRHYLHAAGRSLARVQLYSRERFLARVPGLLA